MDQHPALSGRIEVVRDSLAAVMAKVEGAIDEPHDYEAWAAAQKLSVIDRASGFAHPTVGRYSIAFRYCPAVIARATMAMPWSPEVGGSRFFYGPDRPPHHLFYADNYVRVVAELLVGEAIEGRHGINDPAIRRQRSEDDLDARVPGAIALLTHVQAQAIPPGPDANHQETP